MAMGRDEDRTIIVEMGQIKVFSDHLSTAAEN